MHSKLASPRRMGHAIALGVSLLAAFAAAPARAWDYPLLPHVNGLTFFPETPNNQQYLFAQLSAYYLNECWVVVDTVITDSAHVGVTIRKNPSCADSLTGWTRMFNLGQFAAGMHELTVHCTVQVPGQPDAEEEITVPFEVADGSGPPPPPPGPPTLPLLEGILGGKTVSGPVAITLQGFTPFECTLIHDEFSSRDSIYVAFDPLSSCPDSSRRWTRNFDLGYFAEGDYPVAIALQVNAPDSSSTFRTAFVLMVHDSLPPPPPPPIDSSGAGVSSSRPNPFRDQSAFSVSLDESQPVDVAVFDVLGRRVTTIHHGVLPQGKSHLAWNGRRQDGSRAPGGIYFYQLTLRDRVIHRQVVLLGTP